MQKGGFKNRLLVVLFHVKCIGKIGNLLVYNLLFLGVSDSVLKDLPVELTVIGDINPIVCPLRKNHCIGESKAVDTLFTGSEEFFFFAAFSI